MRCDHPTGLRMFYRNGPHVVERCQRCGANARGQRWVPKDDPALRRVDYDPAPDPWGSSSNSNTGGTQGTLL